MRFPYYDLRHADFEDLVTLICAHLLGSGVCPFCSGPDGGRDARFEGTAARHPNDAHPLRGQFVVQAKHTEHPYGNFGDASFSSDAASSTISSEIERIRSLVARGEADHYLLFSNRRLPGTADERIRKRIIAETGVKTVALFGVARIDLILKMTPSIERTARLSELRAPLRISSEGIAEVIEAFANQKASFTAASPPQDRVSFETKNKINGLSESFSKLIRKHYLSHFDKLRRFLADPRNEALVTRYEEAVAEFNESLVAHASDPPSMDIALVNMYRLLADRDPMLARRTRETKLVLYYMYWHCDLGEDGT